MEPIFSEGLGVTRIQFLVALVICFLAMVIGFFGSVIAFLGGMIGIIVVATVWGSARYNDLKLYPDRLVAGTGSVALADLDANFGVHRVKDVFDADAQASLEVSISST